MAKTISFCQGGGSLNHNNREFITMNVDEDRVEWDETYVKESLEDAYEKCFGEAIQEYNDKQTRADRKKTDYIDEIRHSKNGEHLFYEDIVQIGTMKDTPVIDEDGNLTEAAKEAISVLDQYAKTFQERNPNLYLFNCVMHLDEKTPHLHIDYIPVADGYTKGLSKRNSISKALQGMGIPKAKSKKENEESLWKNREREYIKELCEERGIEIEELGVKRDNYSLPEYKEIMQEVDELKAEADLYKISVEESKERLEAYSEKEDAILKATEHSDKVIEKMCEEATPIPKLFGKDEYVKVPKKIWDKAIKYSRIGIKSEKINDIFDKKVAGIKEMFISEMKKMQESIQDMDSKLKNVFGFIKEQGMMSQYNEYARPKSIHEKIKIGKEKILKAEKLHKLSLNHKKDEPIR